MRGAVFLILLCAAATFSRAHLISIDEWTNLSASGLNTSSPIIIYFRNGEYGYQPCRQHRWVVEWFHKQVQVVTASPGFASELLSKLGQTLPEEGDEYVVLLKFGLNFDASIDFKVISFYNISESETGFNIAQYMELDDPNVVLASFDFPYLPGRKNPDPDQYFQDVIVVQSRYTDTHDAQFERRILMNFLFDRYKDRPKIKFYSSKISYFKCPWRLMDLINVKLARSTQYTSFSGPGDWSNITRFVDEFFDSYSPGRVVSQVKTLNETQKPRDLVQDHRPVLIHSFFGGKTSLAEEIDFFSTFHPPEKMSFFFKVESDPSYNESTIFYPKGLYNEIAPIEITSLRQLMNLARDFGHNGLLCPAISTGWDFVSPEEFDMFNSTDSLLIYLGTASLTFSMEERLVMIEIAQWANNGFKKLYFGRYKYFLKKLYTFPGRADDGGIYLTAKKGNLTMNEMLVKFDKAKIIEFIHKADQKFADAADPDRKPRTGDLPDENYRREARWINFQLLIKLICSVIPIYLTLRYFGHV